MYILNVCKKVLGVIISFEVASQRPPILFLPVDGILVDCYLCFAHIVGKVWLPATRRLSLQLRKRALGFIVGLVGRWSVAMGCTHHCC